MRGSITGLQRGNNPEAGGGVFPTGKETGGEWKAGQMKEHQGKQGKVQGIRMAWQRLAAKDSV